MERVGERQYLERHTLCAWGKGGREIATSLDQQGRFSILEGKWSIRVRSVFCLGKLVWPVGPKLACLTSPDSTTFRDGEATSYVLAVVPAGKLLGVDPVWTPEVPVSDVGLVSTGERISFKFAVPGEGDVTAEGIGSGIGVLFDLVRLRVGPVANFS